MDRDNSLEKHLLSRSYESESHIEEILAGRYSYKGSQKPFLILVPTTGLSKSRLKLITKSELLKDGQTSGNNAKLTNERKSSIRNELRLFIKTTLSNQTKLVKKIQAYNRLKRETNKSKKPFPVRDLLKHYKIPQYEEFIPMNNLWQDYMQNLLYPNSNIQATNILLQKLTTADFNGCLITVLQSKNRNLIGIRGIVAWDTQHSFILCVPRNEDSKEWNENSKEFTPSEQVGGLKIIPKKGSLFGFDVILPSKNKKHSEIKMEQDQDEEQEEEECMGFTIIGSRFDVRSVDRSNKKFKNHNVEDIL